MYVVINETEYRRISGLQFEPETDVTGNTVPINELWVSIKTNDHIPLSSRVELYDDIDQLWAKYWVTYAEREDEYTVRVHGESALARLDTVTMEPAMYNGTSIATVLAEILAPIGDEYELDESFAQKTISGYCPRQSARVRLQWVCLCIGAYLKNYFNDILEILPVEDETDVIIPVDKTYWKPSVTYKDYVTAVRVAYYSYSAGEPTRTDKYVEVNGSTYIETMQYATLINDDVPEGANENVIEFDGVTLVNQNNVSEVLSFMALHQFKRTEISLDVIDNAEYIPGQRVYVFSAEDSMSVGYIGACSFSFGLQAKAKLKMVPVEAVQSATLVITYKWGKMQVGIRAFRFPIGYRFSVENPYLEVSMNGHRYVFRPTVKEATGVMVEDGVSIVQPVVIALDQYQGYLHVVSVDGVEKKDEEVVIDG